MSLLVIIGSVIAALALGLFVYQISTSEPDSESKTGSGPGRDVPGEPPDESPPV